MLLREIKTINSPLVEGVIPVHISMILQEVCRAGKITNTIQAIIMAQLIEFFKYESAGHIRTFNEHQPAKELLDAVKNLPEDQQCDLAGWLLEKLSEAYVEGSCGKWCDPQLALNAWVAWVLRRQD